MFNYHHFINNLRIYKSRRLNGTYGVIRALNFWPGLMPTIISVVL